MALSPSRALLSVIPSAPMTESTVRTRFAPSPTGALHLGNARTALFSWFHARGHGGSFVLRSEDTDAERSEARHLEAFLPALKWLGLDWDEGPDRGGPHGPYCQSERRDRYQVHLDRLLETDQAYPCFCTRAELAAARQRQVTAGEPPRYPGTCAGLDPQARAEQRAAGRSAVLRLRVPAQGDVEYEDLVHGHLRTALETIGDFVIAREDGTPVFLSANAIDDAEMGITHVFRGEDHLPNTPRQLLLLKALGLPAPAYGHLPLVLGEHGRPLAKREGGASLEALREAGYRPEAVVNHLARIGFTPGSDELLSVGELADRFDLIHVGRAAGRHDLHALNHWQKLAVDRLDDETAWSWLQAHCPEDAVELPVEGTAFTAAVRPNVRLPADAWRWAHKLFATEAEPDEDALAEIRRAGGKFFEKAASIDSPAPTEDFRGWAKAVGAATEVRGKDLYRPLRAALTGALAGPELHAVVPLMPTELVYRRLQAGARTYCS